MPKSEEYEAFREVARESVKVAAGGEILLGLSTTVLGIIAVSGIVDGADVRRPSLCRRFQRNKRQRNRRQDDGRDAQVRVLIPAFVCESSRKREAVAGDDLFSFCRSAQEPNLFITIWILNRD